MRNKALIIILLFAINNIPSLARVSINELAINSLIEDPSTININVTFVDGKIRLRWMSKYMNIWEHAMKVKSTLESITVKEESSYLTGLERLDSYIKIEENYLHKSQIEMEEATNNSSEGTGTLANFLMNDQSTQENTITRPRNNTLDKAAKQKKMKDNRCFFSHILAGKSIEMTCAMGMAYKYATKKANKQYAYIITLSEPLN